MSTIVRIDKGANHWYELDGERVPSVTEIQRKAIPKQDVLTGWAGRQSGDYVLDHWDELAASPPSERWSAVAYAHSRKNTKARKLGTRVHKLADRLAAGEEVPVPAELAGYVEAYTQFLFDYDVSVFMSEAVVWSKTHGHVGTLDVGAWLHFPDGDVVAALLDIKTGSGVYDDVAFQFAGYRYADTFVDVDDEGATVERSMPTFGGCWVVHLREGGYDLLPVEVTEETYRGFLYLKESAAAIEANKGAVGEPVEPPIRMEF